MLMLKILGLLLSGAAIMEAPLSSVHMKIFAPSHVWEHQLTTDDYSDPFLLTGPAAMLVARHLYDRGGPFFHEIQHERSLLRKQEERRANGLPENILNSIRHGHPFCNDCGY